ncbi:GntR family transcriptional regulator [Allonocardiopsis opalescens]|uniref:GntR family transcriptional regulator n=1 Tax=Allonocardiopsis opalescens TaxID=1144618 RepID=A0A2T0QFQ0_9ACTN|nr:GntR family transcriptional regulator [Allonocardiopsis opalescens]PRY02673.1 GntR family transcriptional regulator [Allonocardiopsis opalescens]
MSDTDRAVDAAGIARLLRTRILAGEYAPGTMLPSYRDLAATHGVNENVARHALRILVETGQATARQGSGTFVTDAGLSVQPTPRFLVRDQPTRVIPARRHGGSDDGDLHPVVLQVSQDSAPAAVAAALRLHNPEAPVTIRRQILATATGQPAEIRISYLPTHLTHDTPLASPDTLAEPWLDAIAAHTGHSVTALSTVITARPATDPEAAALDLPGGGHALVLVRDETCLNRQRLPIALTRSIFAADSTRLTDEYPPG